MKKIFLKKLLFSYESGKAKRTTPSCKRKKEKKFLEKKMKKLLTIKKKSR